jgi:hypothetical protein
VYLYLFAGHCHCEMVLTMSREFSVGPGH